MPEFQKGDRVGPYVLESLVGSGGFGSVWRARDPAARRTVALKLLTEATYAELEVVAGAAGGTSEHLVRVFGWALDPVPFIAMEYIDGTNLQQELEFLESRGERLSLEEVIRIGSGVAEALVDLHDLQIIHRDVKPANVMIDRRGRVKLTDFGIAKIEGVDSLTRQGILSAYYASPEVWSGAPTPRSDLYALGVLLFQCLVGQTPFRGSVPEVYAQHLNSEPDLGRLPDETPQSLRQLIGRCLAKSQSNRPSTAKSCLLYLETAREELLARTHEPQRFGPWLRDTPHPTRPWAWNCFHESTRTRAVVEVQFAQGVRDLYSELHRIRQGISLSQSLAAFGAEQIFEADILILQPDEEWEQTPPSRFQFWVALEENEVAAANQGIKANVLLTALDALLKVRDTAVSAGVHPTIDSSTIEIGIAGEICVRYTAWMADGPNDTDGSILGFLRELDLGPDLKPLVEEAVEIVALRRSLVSLVDLVSEPRHEAASLDSVVEPEHDTDLPTIGPVQVEADSIDADLPSTLKTEDLGRQDAINNEMVGVAWDELAPTQEESTSFAAPDSSGEDLPSVIVSPPQEEEPLSRNEPPTPRRNLLALPSSAVLQVWKRAGRALLSLARQGDRALRTIYATVVVGIRGALRLPVLAVSVAWTGLMLPVNALAKLAGAVWEQAVRLWRGAALLARTALRPRLDPRSGSGRIIAGILLVTVAGLIVYFLLNKPSVSATVLEETGLKGEPSSSSQTATTIGQSVRVKLLASNEDNTWLRVQYSDGSSRTQGWLPATVLDVKSKDVKGLPIITIPLTTTPPVPTNTVVVQPPATPTATSTPVLPPPSPPPPPPCQASSTGPAPCITKVEVVGTTAIGQPFTLKVTASNLGLDSSYGTISISLPDGAVAQIAPDEKDGVLIYGPGQPIGRCSEFRDGLCSTVSTSSVPAQYFLAEKTVTRWRNGAENSFSIVVVPRPDQIATVALVRFAMASPNGDRPNFPRDAITTDSQQNFPVYRYPLRLGAAGGSPLSLQPGEVRRLVSLTGDNYTAELSRDGRLLAWTSNGQGPWRLRISQAPNFDPTAFALPDQSGDNERPTFSPDGTELAFTSNRDGRFDIFISSISGSVLNKLTKGDGNSKYPSFSPSGQEIVYMSDKGGINKLYMMARNGTNVRQLTSDAGEDYYPVFSPDGLRILFSRVVGGNSDLYSIGADGTSMRRLTSESSRDAVGTYSPDGKWILFESDRARGHHEIYVMSSEGGPARSLTSHEGASNDNVPSVSPDGKLLVFQSSRDGRYGIYAQEFRPE